MLTPSWQSLAYGDGLGKAAERACSNLYLYYLAGVMSVKPTTDLPMQNEVRLMLNLYDDDSRCIPPSFIATLSLTPQHLMFCNESTADGMAVQLDSRPPLTEGFISKRL